MTHLERFMRYVEVEPVEDGCWIWTGPFNVYGNPIFSVGGKKIAARRFIYEHAHGKPIPKDRLAVVPCDDQRCVCGDHVRAVTPSGRNRAAIARGVAYATPVSRMKVARTRQAQSEWGWTEVRELRRLVADGVSVLRAGLTVGIPKPAAYQIARNVTWKDARSELALMAQHAGLL